MMFLEMALLLKSFQIILWLPLHQKKDQEVEDLGLEAEVQLAMNLRVDGPLTNKGVS